MIIRVGNLVFNSKFQPILVELSKGEKDHISFMKENTKLYMRTPEGMLREDADDAFEKMYFVS